MFQPYTTVLPDTRIAKLHSLRDQVESTRMQISSYSAFNLFQTNDVPPLISRHVVRHYGVAEVHCVVLKGPIGSPCSNRFLHLALVTLKPPEQRERSGCAEKSWVRRHEPEGQDTGLGIWKRAGDLCLFRSEDPNGKFRARIRVTSARKDFRLQGLLQDEEHVNHKNRRSYICVRYSFGSKFFPVPPSRASRDVYASHQ